MIDRGWLTRTIVELSSGYLKSVLQYVFYTGGDEREKSAEALTQRLLLALPERRRKNMMTFAEQLEKRGREKGREEGREEGWQAGKKEEARLIAKNMLAKGCDLSLIEGVTGLSSDELRALMH